MVMLSVRKNLNMFILLIVYYSDNRSMIQIPSFLIINTALTNKLSSPIKINLIKLNGFDIFEGFNPNLWLIIHSIHSIFLLI